MSDSASPFDAIFSGAHLDPMEAAQQSMRADLPKRFWKDVSVEERETGFVVLLDGRTAKTPGREVLSSPKAAIADRLAEEWAAIEDRVDPLLLPMTRLINVALEIKPDTRSSILDDIQSYAGTDLVCYRADRPQGLVDRQRTVWDPYLDRLKTHHDLRLQLVGSIMHVEQDREVLEGMRALADMRASDDERLVALSLATSLTGSAVLALALAEPGMPEGRAKTIWQAAHVDEDWNRAQWGEDEEASALIAQKWRDFEAAAFILTLQAAQ